jgi:hypothetical protein
MSYTPFDNITVNLSSDGSSSVTDAFSRVRVSEPYTMFEAKFDYPDHTTGYSNKKFTTTIIGGGVLNYLANESSYELQTNTLLGTKVTRESVYYMQYQLLQIMTGVLSGAKSGVVSRIGYFDDDNGVYFKQSENGLAVVLRSKVTGNVVELEILQSNWNRDKFDGTGNSGVTLDPTKTLIFIIDLQWLGVGRVRFGFNINGSIIWAHEIYNDNRYTTVYMTTACLPIRYEIENIANTTSPTSMKQICCSVLSEGGYARTGVVHVIDSGINSRTVIKSQNSWTPILIIRPSLYFQSKLNHGYSKLVNFSSLIGSSGSAEIQYVILKNPTIVGASWIAHPSSASMMEYDITATSVSGGIIKYQGYLKISSGGNFDVGNDNFEQDDTLLVSNKEGQMTYCIAMKASSNNASVYSSLSWREVY